VFLPSAHTPHTHRPPLFTRAHLASPRIHATHTSARAYARTRTHAHTYADTLSRVRTYTHTHTRARARPRPHAVLTHTTSLLPTGPRMHPPSRSHLHARLLPTFPTRKHPAHSRHRPFFCAHHGTRFRLPKQRVHSGRVRAALLDHQRVHPLHIRASVQRVLPQGLGGRATGC
jgi:hypothetical protein